jgi:hypothetical protein
VSTQGHIVEEGNSVAEECNGDHLRVELLPHSTAMKRTGNTLPRCQNEATTLTFECLYSHSSLANC